MKALLERCLTPWMAWRLAFLLLGVFCVCAFWMTNTCDTGFHLGRLELLARHFQLGGGYPCRVYSEACSGYGYGSPMFYCDFFLVPFALLRAWGVPRILCYGAVNVLPPVVAFFVAWACACWFGLSRREQLAYALGYSLAPSFMLMVLEYNQLGGAFSTAVLPAVVLPLLAFLTEEKLSKRKVLSGGVWLCGGLTVILLSHIISTAITVLFIVGVCMLRLFFLLRHPSRLALLVVVASITLLVTAWFWMPFVEQYLAVETGVRGRGITGGRDLSAYAAKLPGLFFPPRTYNRVLRALTTTRLLREDSFLLWGWLFVPLALMAWRGLEQGIHWRQWKVWMRLSAFVCAVLLCTFFSETLLLVLRFTIGWIQFPSRLFPLWSALSMLLFVKLAFRYGTRWTWTLLLLGLATVTTAAIGQWGIRHFVYGSHIAETSPGIYTASEYTPQKWLQAGNATPMTEITADSSMVYGQTVYEPTEVVDLPRFYYKGYQATIDGRDCPVEESDIGTVRVRLSGKTGDLRVHYVGTLVQRVANWISLGALVGLGVGGVVWLRFRCRSGQIANLAQS